ncbi:hypothetical protein ACIHEJ_07645 [Streptomyces sp. NPDC052301]|uniref:hypothetical protein n=1 Tax=Streptomyces sp. NPDC052301 TaxID=3365687 RepID=UPI0037D82241
MAQTIDLAVPCQVVTLNLVLGPEAGTTTLEGLVARGVVAGRRTVQELAHLFSLPHRVMLDVIHGLWTKGYVSIDFSDGFLELTETAKDLIAAGDGLEDASTQTEQRQFVFEPMTGSVFVFERSQLKAPADSVEVPISQGVGADDLPRGELLRAVRATIRHEQRTRGLRSNILDVSFGNPLISTDGGVRWLSVSGTVQSDPETGRLAVSLSDTSGWNRQARDRFRSQIAALAEQSPNDPFVTSLRNKAEPADPERTDLGHLADRLTALVAQTRTADPTTMEAYNDELTQAAGRLAERVDQLADFRAAATPVAAGEDVIWWRGELIRRARQQLVLSVPTIDYSALNDVFPALEAALARGVTLVFLWGTDPTATLPAKVSTALYDLQARHPEQVLLANRSSRTRACVLIQDDERAFVGTRSVLDFDPGGSVLVQAAPDASGPARCVVDLLLWARRVYPYRSDSRRIAFRHEDFGRTRETTSAPAPGLVPPGRLPTLADGWQDDQVAARVMWAAQWEDIHARLVGAVAALQDGDPVVRMTDDADYRDAVHQALGGTMNRLAITDDRADRIVCGDFFARRLRLRLDAGAVLHLHHPALPAPVSEPGKYDDLLADLRRRRTYREGRAQVRAIVSDHEVLTGSYSPLGRPTARSAGTPHSGHVGLHVLGADFAVAFTRTLGIAGWDALPPPTQPVEAPRPEERAASTDTSTATRLPWKILEARAEDPSCPRGTLRAEIARTLHEHPAPGPDWDTWANWLLEDAWRRNAFLEASLLAPRIGPAAVLSPALTAAAVPVEHGPTGELLFYAVAELLTGAPQERTVALVGTIAELLLRGGETGVLAYTELTSADARGLDGIPPTWSELAELTVAYHQTALTALPLHLLAGEVEQSSQADRIATQWQELAERAQNFMSSRQSFGFASGRYVHESLCESGGFLHKIITVGLAGGDTESGREELAALLPDRDIREYIDKIVAEMPRLPGPRKRQQIQWSRHLNYAERLATMVDHARRLIRDTAEFEDRDSAKGPVSADHLPLAAFVAKQWNQLFSEADALGDPYRMPALALLKQLRPLSRSRKEPHDHPAA